MSNAYTNRVWKQKELRGGKLLVMLALAGHADDAGECWPGMPLLMEKTRLTDRQLRRVINDLAAASLITIEERAIGRGKRPHYKLFPAEKADIITEEKRTLLPPLEEKADISDNKSGHLLHEKADISDTDQSYVRREPILEPKEEPLQKEEGEKAQAHPAHTVVATGIPGAATLKLDSPYLKNSQFVKGFISPGTGRNAVEVYYERFEITSKNWRLTAPQEDDLVRTCKDLVLLREVVTAYDQANFEKPRNMRLIFDWYREPSRFREGQNGNHSRGNQADHQQPAVAQFTTAQRAAYDSQRRTDLPF